MLLEALGSPWELEYPVSGWPRTQGYPASYKLDLGHPTRKVGIEVHGRGHGKKAGPGTERDRKKRAFLEERGWKVLWVWNEEILTDLSGTLKQLQATISPTGSWSITATR